eukprot:5425066-Amphidinium_carterae.1
MHEHNSPPKRLSRQFLFEAWCASEPQKRAHSCCTHFLPMPLWWLRPVPLPPSSAFAVPHYIWSPRIQEPGHPPSLDTTGVLTNPCKELKGAQCVVLPWHWFPDDCFWHVHVL